MKTRAEVEALMRDWEGDPSWDIYDTEGFEEYSKELRLFQRFKEAEREKKIRERVDKDMMKMGLEPLNIGLLFLYLQELERRIATLESTEVVGWTA